MLSARLKRLDVVGNRAGAAALTLQVAVAIPAALLVFGLRSVLEVLAPGTGPFAPVYPVVLVATLLGRLPAGLMSWLLTMAVVALVPMHSDGAVIAQANGPSLTAINLVSTLLVVLMVEAARRQSATLIAEREARLAERDMLLEEVDHRLKNNLAMLAGLLGLQVRETTNDEAREVIARTLARLQSLTKVYESLRYEPGTVTVLDAAVLIRELCASLRDALALDSGITLEVEVVQVLITRDRASALALLINEIVTNAAKHAFGERKTGRIRVRISREGEGGALLEISDDGRGMARQEYVGSENGGSAQGGRGRHLLDALAEMAGGDYKVESSDRGTRCMLHLRRLP